MRKLFVQLVGAAWRAVRPFSPIRVVRVRRDWAGGLHVDCDGLLVIRQGSQVRIHTRRLVVYAFEPL